MTGQAESVVIGSSGQIVVRADVKRSRMSAWVVDVDVLNLGPSYVLVKSWFFLPEEMTTEQVAQLGLQIHVPLDKEVLISPGESQLIPVGSAAGKWAMRIAHSDRHIRDQFSFIAGSNSPKLVMRCFDVTGERLIEVKLDAVRSVDPNVDPKDLEYLMYVHPSVQ
ncbi:hypothetical protein [Deinococcus aquiradiocola]|uniref:Uncharacterized protein n=1 Tax=Deinococcus aquiradiocola TaxID=393059 RepID=A0A917P7G6_9DEIO|nr:hypothetical protein [Deinococcus aquiradiocola]GGJ65260.1 hypothetical protein GCM10008939_06470 [Deinococcus aquiradiocola]